MISSQASARNVRTTSRVLCATAARYARTAPTSALLLISSTSPSLMPVPMMRHRTLIRFVHSSSSTCGPFATTRFTATSSVRAMCQSSQTIGFKFLPGRTRIWSFVSPASVRSKYEGRAPASATWTCAC